MAGEGLRMGWCVSVVLPDKGWLSDAEEET